MFSNEETKKLFKTVSLFLIILSVFFVIKVIGEIKTQRFIGSGTTATNTITVSGVGKVFAVPDIATISFSVRGEGKTVKEAQEKVNEIANSAIDFVKSSGVEEKDIKLASNSFYPKYETLAPCFNYPCPNKEPKIIGYEVNRSVTVKVRNADSAGAIVDGLATKSVTDLTGPNFTIDDEDAIQDEAREDAITDAREKAERLADQLGVSIVRIVGFSENGGGYPIMYARPESANMSMGAADMKVEADLPMGENEYSSNVTITYEIR
jgi:uncharacterized protein YggE